MPGQPPSKLSPIIVRATGLRDYGTSRLCNTPRRVKVRAGVVKRPPRPRPHLPVDLLQGPKDALCPLTATAVLKVMLIHDANRNRKRRVTSWRYHRQIAPHVDQQEQQDGC